jgi:uncharacterized protein (DUF1800 family)/fibronectin type 3 domain-containing protein
VYAVLTGSIVAALPSGTAAGGHGERAGRRSMPVIAAPASAPARIVAHAASGRVWVEWSPLPGAVGYKVYRGVAGVWSPDPIATVWRSHFNDHHILNGALHAYKVAAFNKGGIGPMSAEASATPLAPPQKVEAVGGDRQVTVTWLASAGATGYIVMRGIAWDRLVPIATNVNATKFVDTGLTNGTKYIYRIRAVALNSESKLSDAAWAKPQGAPPADAPANLTAAAGNGFVKLAWNAVTGATSYQIFRSTTGTFDAPAIATVTTTTFKNEGLINGTAYSYRVAARNAGGNGPYSSIVTATPNAPPAAPTNLTATAGNVMVTLGWTPVAGATGYRVYRGTATNAQAAAPIATDLTAPAFVDASVTNGVTYFYQVTATAAGAESARSPEASATPEGAPPSADPTTLSAFRLLRQATWGPKPGDVDRVKAMGTAAFIDEQMSAPMSTYPNTLYDQSVELAQEHFMSLGINGPDQLRQRVAFALHKIWVVSAVEINNPRAIVPYYRLMMNGAFGNYRDLMRSVTLNPAMGRYLNMLNNRAQAVTGVAANENYARELMQLFTLGLAELNPDGTPRVDGAGAPVPSYSEDDVKALARILTGWTFGDGNAGTIPGGLAGENYTVPMEAVAATRLYHDVTEKTFLGETFPAGVAAATEMDHALDVIFNHPNVGPFVARQLIQQLVTSNPSPGYVADIAGVFGAPGAANRGDLGAVVRAILMHPEAQVITPTSGKLSEPVLYALSIVRGLNATVTDHPFLSDLTAEMGQRVFFPPSVFSYFSPGYRVRGTGTPPLGGPEFQGLTSVTSLERVNFAGRLLGGHFGTDVAVNYAPFTSIAADAAALVDYVNVLFMGGRMSEAERTEIVNAVRVSPATATLERARTALYLTLVAAQAQVDN